MNHIYCLVIHKTECKSTTFLYTDKIFFHKIIHNTEYQQLTKLKIILRKATTLRQRPGRARPPGEKGVSVFSHSRSGAILGLEGFPRPKRGGRGRVRKVRCFSVMC